MTPYSVSKILLFFATLPGFRAVRFLEWHVYFYHRDFHCPQLLIHATCNMHLHLWQTVPISLWWSFPCHSFHCEHDSEGNILKCAKVFVRHRESWAWLQFTVSCDTKRIYESGVCSKDEQWNPFNGHECWVCWVRDGEIKSLQLD